MQNRYKEAQEDYDTYFDLLKQPVSLMAIASRETQRLLYTTTPAGIEIPAT